MRALSTYPSRVFPGDPSSEGHCGRKVEARGRAALPLSLTSSRVGEGASCLRVHLGWGSGWLPPPSPQVSRLKRPSRPWARTDRRGRGAVRWT